MVSHALHESLSPEGLKHLHYHFYVGADQTTPILAKAKKRSCHVKLMIIDEEIRIQGNGNQGSQSWYHSQEINVMLQSKEVCGNWIDGLRRCQRTGIYGKVRNWHRPRQVQLVQGDCRSSPEGKSRWGFLNKETGDTIKYDTLYCWCVISGRVGVGSWHGICIFSYFHMYILIQATACVPQHFVQAKKNSYR